MPPCRFIRGKPQPNCSHRQGRRGENPRTSPSSNPKTAGTSDSVELMQVRSNSLNWIFLTVIVTFHLGPAAALFFFHWSSLVIFLAMGLMRQSVGTTISYHRQLTHRSFTTPKWVEYAMGSAAQWRCRAALYIGLPCIVCTTNSQTNPEIRRQMVVTHGLDLTRRASQRNHDALTLRA